MPENPENNQPAELDPVKAAPHAGTAEDQELVVDFKDLMHETPVITPADHAAPRLLVPDANPQTFLQRTWYFLAPLYLLVIAAAAFAIVRFSGLDTQLRRVLPSISADRQAYRLDAGSMRTFGQGSALGKVFDISQDGIYYASAEDKTLLVQNLVTGRGPGPILFNSPILSLALSPAGSKAAVGLEDGALFLQAVDSGSVLVRVPGIYAQLDGLKFSQDGTVLAAGGNQGSISLVSVQDGSVLYSGELNGAVVSVDVLTDPARAALALADGSVRILDYSIGRTVAVLETDLEIRQVLLSPAGTRVLTLTAENMALWDLAQPDPLWQAELAAGTHCLFISQPTLICTQGSELAVWRTESGDVFQVVETYLEIERLKYNAAMQELTLYAKTNQAAAIGLMETAWSTSPISDLIGQLRTLLDHFVIIGR